MIVMAAPFILDGDVPGEIRHSSDTRTEDREPDRLISRKIDVEPRRDDGESEDASTERDQLTHADVFREPASITVGR